VSPGQSLRATSVPVSQIATSLDPAAPQVNLALVNFSDVAYNKECKKYIGINFSML
jgi:hypothetical protein